MAQLVHARIQPCWAGVNSLEEQADLGMSKHRRFPIPHLPPKSRSRLLRKAPLQSVSSNLGE
eukprot:4107145-Pyramimonas_sp.AAC.1